MGIVTPRIALTEPEISRVVVSKLKTAPERCKNLQKQFKKPLPVQPVQSFMQEDDITSMAISVGISANPARGYHEEEISNPKHSHDIEQQSGAGSGGGEEAAGGNADDDGGQSKQVMNYSP